jgi:hypothetical protein
MTSSMTRRVRMAKPAIDPGALADHHQHLGESIALDGRGAH